MSFVARLVNRLFDAAFSQPLEPLWQRRLRGRVLCLLYHRVDDTGRFPFLDHGGSPNISPKELERDVSFWVERGATFGTFRDLRKGWFPGPTEIGVIVCFDDGFRSTYELGLPVLERLGIRGTVFQISSIVGSNQLLWEHRLYQLLGDTQTTSKLAEHAVEYLGIDETSKASLADRLRFDLDREKLNQLLDEMEEDTGNEEHEELARGLYPDEATILAASNRAHEIGSHGHKHQPRRRLSNEEFRKELQSSRKVLGEILKEAPEAYSHPFGDHRPRDPDIIRDYFKQAAIVEPRAMQRSESPWRMPRCSWPGPARNDWRQRRWLLSGHI